MSQTEQQDGDQFDEEPGDHPAKLSTWHDNATTGRRVFVQGKNPRQWISAPKHDVKSLKAKR